MSIDIGSLTEKLNPNLKKKFNLVDFISKIKSFVHIPQKEILFFIQNLQVMVRAGLPLDKSLKTLALQTKNQKMKNILEDLAKQTEAGVALNVSLSKYQNIFGMMTVNMIKAGEVSGRLEDVLKQVFIQIKKSYELKSKIKGAMTYPVVVVVAMIGMGIGMFIFVVPKITSLFSQMNAQLPLPTRIVIHISNFTAHNGILVGVILIILIVLFILSFKHEKISFFYHKLYLILPILGPIVKKINLAKFSRTVSSLIKTDISIVKTLDITSQVVGNKIYRKALKESSSNIKSGASLTDILKKYPNLFPPILIQMTAAGEETGSLDEILAELADFYEEDIDQIMKTLPSIIEPVLILILGVGVGAMAVAIIMPMYSLSEQIK